MLKSSQLKKRLMFNNSQFSFVFGLRHSVHLILLFSRLLYICVHVKTPRTKIKRVLKKKIFSTVQKWFGVLETYTNVLSDENVDFTNVQETYRILDLYSLTI